MARYGSLDEDGISRVLVRPETLRDVKARRNSVAISWTSTNPFAAANNKGKIIKNLMSEHGQEPLSLQMSAMEYNAYITIRNLLNDVGTRYSGGKLMPRGP